MTVEEMYARITQDTTPEQVLKNHIEEGLIQYDRLKTDSKGRPVHPIMIITMAAWDLGWKIAVEGTEDEAGEVRGLIVGTEEYLNTLNVF